MRTMIIAAALAAAASPAVAQNVDVSGGLVDVTIQDVTVTALNNFLNEAQIAALNDLVDAGAVTVQVPIGIAANVCPTVNAAALAQDLAQDGEASCTAENATQAFANQVVRQVSGLRQMR